MNNKFVITYSRDGYVRTTFKQGLNELTEFIRNCDAYDRVLLRIEPLESE
jgi:hypothetical protein